MQQVRLTQAGEAMFHRLRAAAVAIDRRASIVLASDDVKLANSEAVKNLDQHVPLSASP